MKNQITIREAVTENDAAAFWEQLHAYHKRDIFTDSDKEELEYFLGQAYRDHMMKINGRPQDRCFFLFFHRGGQDIGFAMPVIFTTEDGKCFIMEFCVYPEFRGNGTGKASLKKYVEMINAQHPDLILISGDLIDNSVVPLYTENMAEELANLKAPMGIYMVLGNHEYISGIDESIRYIKSTQIQLLRDSVVTLPNGIQLIGRDDRHNRKRHSLQELMVNIDKSKPIILLDHQPFDLEKTEAAGIDLQFSGHTHHGQIWPINWVTDYIFEQSHGYRQWGNSHVYVSSGLSLWGPPFRIGTHSEMVIFNFQ